MKQALGFMYWSYVMKVRCLELNRIKPLAYFSNDSWMTFFKRPKDFGDQIQKGNVVIVHGAAPVDCGLGNSQFNAGMPCRQIAELST